MDRRALIVVQGGGSAGLHPGETEISNYSR